MFDELGDVLDHVLLDPSVAVLGKGAARVGRDRMAALEHGWGVCNPPEAVRGKGRGSAPALCASWMSVDAPGVVVVGCKQAEDGEGLIVRLWETGDTTVAGDQVRQVSLTVPVGVQAASLCTMTEEPIRSLALRRGKIRVTIRRRGIATVRLA